MDYSDGWYSQYESANDRPEPARRLRGADRGAWRNAGGQTRRAEPARDEQRPGEAATHVRRPAVCADAGRHVSDPGGAIADRAGAVGAVAVARHLRREAGLRPRGVR